MSGEDCVNVAGEHLPGTLEQSRETTGDMLSVANFRESVEGHVFSKPLVGNNVAAVNACKWWRKYLGK